ncbi:hypothetical protein B0H65DRAFT_439926 [Neurospora tetraspora]|uniref:Uncharacterized protein n=1 Tax=Neurospora tetraspora TaxID=94610 RepID=A0AAE0JJU7_9PEZI|nr:hypothetical protein B0H65DRAFT_439926 [Neurospora tetraspora]
MTLSPPPTSSSKKRNPRARSTASVHSKEAASTSLPANPPLRSSLRLREKRQQAATKAEAKSVEAMPTNDMKTKTESTDAPKKKSAPPKTKTKVSAKPAPRKAASESEPSTKKTASKIRKTKPRKKKAIKERERWPGKRKLDYFNTDPVYW